MLNNIIHKISAERVDIENPFLPPFFYQQQKAYTFCLQFVRDKTVLEVGSGSGYGAHRLAKSAKNVLGIDSDEIAVKEGMRRYSSGNLKFVCSKIEDYNAKQKFDVVVAFQVLEHVENPQAFLKKMASLKKKDGLLLISTPNKDTQSYNENPYHYREYSFVELNNILFKYFTEIKFYSLLGDNVVKKFEKMRRKHVLKMLKKDRFKLRRFVPRRFKQAIFNFVSFFNRVLYLQKNKKINSKISEVNYRIVGKPMSDSIDIIAVTR